MEQESLKSCPFCNGEARINKFSNDNLNMVYRAECTKCGLMKPALYNELSAISGWNNRSTGLIWDTADVKSCPRGHVFFSKCIEDKTPSTGWISVDTPPEDHKNVLVTNGYTIALGFNGGGYWYVHPEAYDDEPPIYGVHITHWQPLPQPPKESE